MVRKASWSIMAVLLLAVSAFAAPPTLSQALAGLRLPATGPEDAAVTVYEIGNYTCPFCKEAHPVLHKLLAEYKGRIRFLYFPYIRQYDGDSRDASLAAYAAWEQGKFWEMHDLLFESAPELSQERILALADKLGLDRGKIQAAVKGQGRLGELQKGLDLVHTFDVWSTPTLVIGDQVLKGSHPYDDYKAAIEKALAGKKGASVLSPLRKAAGAALAFLFPQALAAEDVPAPQFGSGCAPLYVKVGRARPVAALSTGDEAPPFTLPSSAGGSVSLADFRGKKNVLLAFLPAAFTPV